MGNRGGFSWRRLAGVSAAKARVSRRIGVPLTKSGRQRKLGRLVSGGGCLLIVAVVILAACAGAATATPGKRPLSAPSTPSTTSITSTPSTRPSAVAGPTANTAANLRAGPGTNYPIIGSAAQGQHLAIVARNPAGDWYQLANGAWISGQLVANAPVVPVAAMIPTAAATAVPAAVSTARGLPSVAASQCDCSKDTLNCPDFLSPWDAQACYLRCKAITGRDVHGLDRDGDGDACEWKD